MCIRDRCYAPPFSSAKDPVNMAGFTACNVMKGDLRQIFIEDLKDLDPEKDLLVDIRTQSEYDAGTIGNAVLIPLDSIPVSYTHLDVYKRQANDHLDVITPVARHAVFKSALFMEKGEHLSLIHI